MIKGLDKMLEWLILEKIAPLMNHLPQKYKTLTGIILIGLAWVCQNVRINDKINPWLDTGYTFLIWAGPILTGIGVFHKSVAVDPKEIGVK